MCNVDIEHVLDLKPLPFSFHFDKLGTFHTENPLTNYKCAFSIMGDCVIDVFKNNVFLPSRCGGSSRSAWVEKR